MRSPYVQSSRSGTRLGLCQVLLLVSLVTGTYTQLRMLARMNFGRVPASTSPPVDVSQINHLTPTVKANPEVDSIKERMEAGAVDDKDSASINVVFCVDHRMLLPLAAALNSTITNTRAPQRLHFHIMLPRQKPLPRKENLEKLMDRIVAGRGA
eukprot:CAMPEP_0118944408 /NCGR_PEP_ID=MMETSP1169-20130426/40248_1 /TAXON_ID=36882 /ORGANISM="Pyramimonas obovata, Strain CCMP722" /LENGTH=153 /DNA_ID=CAMNT_0006889887 /DNA_START=105 /DNA_END=563 /DNA_ORIENTATION=+